MTSKKEIGAGQLLGLMLLSRLSVALTFPFDFAGSLNNQEWLVSLLFFPFLLLLLLPSYFLYKKTGLSTLQSAYKTSPIIGGGTAVLLCFFFLLSTAVNLSRFNIFMTSTTGTDQSPLFFPLLLIIPAFYAAYKGLEAISRTALIALVIGFISVAVIILAGFFEIRPFKYRLSAFLRQKRHSRAFGSICFKHLRGGCVFSASSKGQRKYQKNHDRLFSPLLYRNVHHILLCQRRFRRTDGL